MTSVSGFFLSGLSDCRLKLPQSLPFLALIVFTRGLMRKIKVRRSLDNLKDGCVNIFICHTGGAIIDNGAKENFCVKDTTGHLTIKASLWKKPRK